jgi:DNA topoisomerase VI subunit A
MSIFFEPILQIIDNPKSAFEQYHALRLMERMVSHLNKTQKQKLREVFYKQRDYDPAKNQWLERDSDRWMISERILSVIGEQ